jgi:hypothetical protein
VRINCIFGFLGIFTLIYTHTHTTIKQTEALPTRQNILASMQWLVQGAQPGDSLFFHYSGHGGSVRDRNGDEVRVCVYVCMYVYICVCVCIYISTKAHT